MAMDIYLIRHGETDWNKKRKLQGQVDIPLNEFGKLLAKETAPALADVPFAVCYTSPLKRAAETAIAPKTNMKDCVMSRSIIRSQSLDFENFLKIRSISRLRREERVWRI